MPNLKAGWDAFWGNSPFQKWGKDTFYQQNGFNFGSHDLGTLTRQGFQSNTYIYSIINRIAETGSNIPVIVEAIKPDGEVVIVEPESPEFNKYKEYYQFVHKPNKDNNYKSFKYESLVYQLTQGNVMQLGIQPTGFPISEAHNLQPQHFGAETRNEITGPVVTKYTYSPNGGNWTIEPEKIMHLKKFNPNPEGSDGWLGMSPLQAAFKTMITSNETNTAAASLISNKGSAGMLTSKADRALTTGEKEMMDDALKGRIGGSTEFGSIKVTSGNFDFIKMSMSPTDLKLIEMNVLSLRDLCSVYGAKSRMFNDPQGASFNNNKQDAKDFILNAVLPPLEDDLEHWNAYYNPSWNERDGVTYRVRVDKSKIEALQEDQNKLIEKQKKRSEIIIKILSGIGITWTEDSAKQQLIDALGMTEAEAENIIETVERKNASLEVLRSLSPLLANKIVEKLEDEEIRALLK